MRLESLAIGALVVAAALLTAAESTPSVSVVPGLPLSGVQVNDAANRVWTLQESTNLTTWTDVETVKIHNSRYRSTITNDPARNRRFFRTLLTPSRPDLTSTVESALLLPAAPFNYAQPDLPSAFSLPPIADQDNMPADNLTTDAGAALGRVLFYDKRLSTNGTVSCASCHQAAHGFSDPRRFSVGFNGGMTGRNSMGLSNGRWYERERFFWDERAATLEAQVLMPIQNSVEMGLPLEVLTNRLAAEPFYTNLFARAFGTPEINTNRISRALAQFVRSIVSIKSKYDVGRTNDFSNFTAAENLGRQIFNGPVSNCSVCHDTDNFVPGALANNIGLEFPFVDRGIGGISGLAQDDGVFKVPSLRNIELTAPYMHDGRFATLEEVVEFYDSGVVDNPNLSPLMRNPEGQPGARRLHLTTEEKAALVAFLKTLTDPGLAADEKLSDPFNYGQ
jgi:cytochrome c peroxidase